MKINMVWLYQNWAKTSIILAFYLLLAMVTFLNDDNFLLFLIWLQVPLYMLHQFEEHAWPGGFKSYVNKKVFNVTDRDSPLDDINIFWINIPIVWILMPLCALLSRFSLVIGAWMPFFAVINSLTHVIAMIVKREYNPGITVSLFVNIPVSVYTIFALYQAGVVTDMISILSIVFAIILHIAIIVYAKKRSSGTSKSP